MMFRNCLLVALGGGAGSVARYLCQRWVGELFAYPWPFGTFVVNVSGCLVIGIVLGIAEKNSLITSEWRLLLATGFCGGYTTFSAFAFENAGLLRAGNYLSAGLYIALSVLLGIAAVFGGMALFR
jgi:CrcB protein